MKCYKRYLSLLACLVLLLTLFSPVANADEIEVPPYHIYAVPKITSNGVSGVGTGVTFYPKDENATLRGWTYQAGADAKTITLLYTIVADSNSFFLAKGQLANITLENVKFIVEYGTSLENYSYESSRINSVNVYVTYTNGQVSYVDATLSKKSNGFYDISFTVDATQNVHKIDIEMTDQQTTYRNYMNVIFGEFNITDNNLRIDIQDKNTGLLQGIGDKLSSGFNGMLDKLTSGFSDLKNGLSNVVNGIVELPNKLWTLISDGLKNLFVPSENFMVQYKDDWDMLLGEKLGAVYEVSQIIFGAWDDVQNADETNLIDIPIVSIPLPDNQEFTFGGYQVKIVPDGFSVLVEAVKLAIGIGCTFMFVNGLRKRYDEVMGVEK